MGIHAENKKSLKLLEFQGFGGDYWTRTSDLMRVNGLGKLFLIVSATIQHRRLRIQNYLTVLYHSVSVHSAQHCGFFCGQTTSLRIGDPKGSGFLVCSVTLNGELSNSFSGLIPKANATPP